MAKRDRLQWLAEDYAICDERTGDVQLWNFIVRCLGESFKPSEIKAYLLSAGCDERRVRNILRSIKEIQRQGRSNRPAKISGSPRRRKNASFR